MSDDLQMGVRTRRLARAVLGCAAICAAASARADDSKPHNGILATAMQWAGYVEKSGYGTEDIVRKCKAWGLRDPEYHPSSVDFRLVLWRQEIKEPCDFTQLGEVGEVGCKKGVESSAPRGVESDAKSPIKSRVCAAATSKKG